MAIWRFLRRLGLKSILRSALTLEEEIYGLFEALPAELAGLELPESLKAIIGEEREHQQLLRDMIEGRLSEEEIQRLVSGRGPQVHDLRDLQPVTAGPYLGVVERLRRILQQEEGILRFFTSLWRQSRLPFVRAAFRFLAEQEQTHVLLLRRLLGEPEGPAPSPGP